jgi:hypothetical protein
MEPRTNADRSWSWAAIAFAIVVTVGVAFVGWALPSFGACGGDGGSPAALPGSHLADVCHWRELRAPWLIGGPAGLVLLGGVAGKARRHWWPSAVALVTASALAVVPYLVIWAADGPSQRL